MLKILLIGLGGMLGSILRYSFYYLPLPYIKTFYINLIGAFLIGFLSAFFEKYTQFNGTLKLFLITGLCGGFTTFSTFSLEFFNLLKNNNFFEALIYAIASVLLSLVLVCIGYYFGKIF